MLNKYCKKSKIILIVSWILALIVLVIGGISSCEGDKEAYDGKVVSISLNSKKTSYSDEIMYAFTPSSSKSYTIAVDCSTGSGYLYVLHENSQTEIEEREYVASASFSRNTSKTVYLSSANTYYIYVVSTYEKITVEIS